jgi:hypothetical protein
LDGIILQALRDTAILQRKHIATLEQSSFDFISLYGDNQTVLPDIVPEEAALTHINPE